MKIIALCIACLLVVSCKHAPPSASSSKISGDSFFISKPEIGIVETREVGQPLLAQETGTRRKRVNFQSDQIIGNFEVKTGKYVITAQNGEYAKFGNVRMVDVSSRKERRGDLYLFVKDEGGSTLCLSRTICAVVAYKIDWHVEENENFSQKTLIYNGILGSKVTLGYREFSGGYARPAFSNDVTYDLDVSKILGYKNARLEVLGANNVNITYRVISNFE